MRNYNNMKKNGQARCTNLENLDNIDGGFTESLSEYY